MTARWHATLQVLILGALLVGTAEGQIASEQIDRLVLDAMKQLNVAGVSVGVVKDGKIVHQRGYGVRSIEKKDKVDEHTNFAIASNSKAFTTAALSILVDEGKLSWQDRVKKHIPEFRMYNAYVTENFSIEDLLTHRSGLGLGVGDLMFFPDGSDFGIDDIINSFQYFEPQSAFRTKFDYDNLLYMIAGEVIKRASGMKWEDFVEKRIFKPLDMDHTFSNLERASGDKNLATPHTTEGCPIRPISHFMIPEGKSNGAAASILSNVNDLCNWMLLHLNEGRHGEGLKKRLFSAARQREMWRIHTTLPARWNPRYRTHFRGYGLGWGLRDVCGNMSVSHTGGLPGMLSRTVLIPDIELGVVVLTNTANGGAGLFTAVSRTIVDSYLGLDDAGWTKRVVAAHQRSEGTAQKVVRKVWDTVEKAKGTKIETATYIGIYEDRWFGKVEVFLKGGKLWMRSHRSPKLNGQMHFYRSNAFAIRWEYQNLIGDAFAIFKLDEEGRAQGVELKGISPNIDFSFDFHDLDLRRTK